MEERNRGGPVVSCLWFLRHLTGPACGDTHVQGLYESQPLHRRINAAPKVELPSKLKGVARERTAPRPSHGLAYGAVRRARGYAYSGEQRQ